MRPRHRMHPPPRPLPRLPHESRSRALPPLEPAPRRRRIEPHDALTGSPAHVPPPIQQDIPEGIPHLGRRPQHHVVIPVQQHRPLPPEHPVHRPSQPGPQGLHPPPQGLRIPRLHDQVDVVRLEGVVDEPEVPPLTGPGEGPLDLPDQSHRPERGHPGPHLQGDVAGMPGGQGRPGEVPHAGVGPGLPSGTGPLPAPAVVLELELLGATTTHDGVEYGDLIIQSNTFSHSGNKPPSKPPRPAPDARQPGPTRMPRDESPATRTTPLTNLPDPHPSERDARNKHPNPHARRSAPRPSSKGASTRPARVSLSS